MHFLKLCVVTVNVVCQMIKMEISEHSDWFAETCYGYVCQSDKTHFHNDPTIQQRVRQQLIYVQ